MLSLLFGAIGLSFGLLKFISPFKDWYATQIATSGLPHSAYGTGIAGEIITGLLFLLPFTGGVNEKLKRLLLILAHVAFIVIMLSATVVHLIPDVPADALPLKIKPPIIPLLFLAVAVFNFRTIIRAR